MKHLKKKLVAATAMLMVSAMMLTSVSYAWFTLSTNPEMKNMTATVAANKNLEIALDNNYANEAAVNNASTYSADGTDKDGTPQGSTMNNPYTWGNLLDLGTAFTAMAANISPVKFTNTSGTVSFEAPTYGADGRVEKLEALSPTYYSDHSSVTTATGGVKGYAFENGAAQAFGVDFWVRTNTAGDLALQTAGIDRGAGTEGAGSYIQVPGYASMEAEEKEAVAAYFAKLKVAFVVGAEATVQVTLGEVSTEGKIELSCSKITSLGRNSAKEVSMYVYLDGETISNADALLETLSGVKFNIQFKNTAITTTTTGGGTTE